LKENIKPSFWLFSKASSVIGNIITHFSGLELSQKYASIFSFNQIETDFEYTDMF